VNPQDRQEFDRVYDRLIVQLGRADRTVAQLDGLAKADHNRKTFDKIREKQFSASVTAARST
jgi:hypothetical protein